MTDADLADLREVIAGILARDEADGVVVTHGTNTLEETAWLLHLTLATDAPVVLTGAMRPASGLSGDGPLNLGRCGARGGSAEARGLGTLVVMDDTIHGARDVTKSNTAAGGRFRRCRMTGRSGRVDGDGRVVITHRPTRATCCAAPTRPSTCGRCPAC